MKKEYCCDPHDSACSCGPRGRLVRPRLLLLIKNKSSYGYELLARLNDNNPAEPVVDAGAAYRSLREMEKAGLIKSAWVKGKAGPAKRIYKITSRGERQLKDWAKIIEQRKVSLEKFIKKYKKEEKA